MNYHVFLSKETRANERRVALVPKDVAQLCAQGHRVSVESGAGLEAGHSDPSYTQVGARIVDLSCHTLEHYASVFRDIDVIVRAKRPNRAREQLELLAVRPGTALVGALDPMESGSTHVAEYVKAELLAYSIDQAILPASNPMNILASMSHLAGKMALQDALRYCKHEAKQVVLLGAGVVGQSALTQAMQLGLSTTVLVGDDRKADHLRALGASTQVVHRSLPLQDQQRQIRDILLRADVVIASARTAGHRAPLLIPASTLRVMKPGAVVVDMAISEGGNVHGSRHDSVINTANGVSVVNVSGYPKALPREASVLWSRASLQFILQMANDPASLPVKPLATV